MSKFSLAICSALVALACTNTVAAQQAAPAATSPAQSIKRTPLQRFDIPGTSYEAVIGLAEIAANVSMGRHTHPGPESGYMLEGSLELLIDGEQPRHLKAGESYKTLPLVIHDAKTGPQGAKVIATYVIPKGQPLALPAK